MFVSSLDYLSRVSPSEWSPGLSKLAGRRGELEGDLLGEAGTHLRILLEADYVLEARERCAVVRHRHARLIVARHESTRRQLLDAVWKPKYYMNRPRILVPRQIEVQRKVEVEGGGVKSAKPVT